MPNIKSNNNKVLVSSGLEYTCYSYVQTLHSIWFYYWQEEGMETMISNYE